MKALEEFERFYRTDLLPVLQEFETRRLKICRNLALVFGGLAAVLGVLALAIPAFRQLQPLIIAIVVAGALGAGAWWLLTKNFVLEFKQEIIREIVHFCDPELTYSPVGYIGEGRFQESLIFKHRIDRYRGEDLVSGTLEKTAVEFSELHAEYKTRTTDSKGRTRTQWHTIFKGLFFIADFNKDFKGTTVVLPDVAERLFGFIGKKLQEMNLARADLVKLEDPEFEKLFAVYGTDQVESRYILSTSLMRRITEFKKKTGNTLYLSFVHSRVFIAVSTGRNMFEPRILSTLLDFKVAREYLEDLQLATGIVDDLNLNTRIWTKE
ncbi:MAG: DUF3137 domain-containing protein [Lentisphaerae bacterium]|nr:DUF3137 domain-containing protein [Lentisphaerota bacterium]